MVSKFYRLFPYNMSDWGFLWDRLQNENPREAKEAMSDVQWVHWDLFRQAFSIESIFSWVEHGLEHGVGNEPFLLQLAATRVFKIVTENVARKRVPHDMLKDMRLPL